MNNSLTMPLRVLIIDDEPDIRAHIESVVQNIPGCIVVATCGSVSEGKVLLKTTKPNILLLDIQLSDGTGFDILNEVNSDGIKVIFITAYNQYALKAIKVGAIDYLLKPFSATELENAIKKADTNFILDDERIKISRNIYDGEKLKRIVLRSQYMLQIVEIDDILYCQSFEGYTTFYFNSGGKFLISKKLKEYEEILGSSGFIRCHQSFLVNIEYIHKLIREGEILLKNGTSIPVSQRKKEEVLKLISAIK